MYLMTLMMKVNTCTEEWEWAMMGIHMIWVPLPRRNCTFSLWEVSSSTNNNSFIKWPSLRTATIRPIKTPTQLAYQLLFIVTISKVGTWSLSSNNKTMHRRETTIRIRTSFTHTKRELSLHWGTALPLKASLLNNHRTSLRNSSFLIGLIHQISLGKLLELRIP